MRDRGISARALSKMTDCSRATIGDWLLGKTRPNVSARKKLQSAIRLDPAGWEVVAEGSEVPAIGGQVLVAVPGHGAIPGQIPLFSREQSPGQQSDAGRGLREALDALDVANRGLEDRTLPVADVTKLLTAKLNAAKAVANLSGELDASELAAWKRGAEFRHLLHLAAEALRPWPEAGRAFATALGVAHGEQARDAAEAAGDATPVMCPGSADRMSLSTNLERLTAWLSAEGQDPVIGAKAMDSIIYPLAGRERELAESDPQLARDIASAVVRAALRLETSKIAHAPYETYCRAVATRLEVEAARGDKMVAFRRDFGELAMSRAREAFGIESR
jgi:transcriptional regulator with XRE-family HTH domain